MHAATAAKTTTPRTAQTRTGDTAFRARTIRTQAGIETAPNLSVEWKGWTRITRKMRSYTSPQMKTGQRKSVQQKSTLTPNFQPNTKLQAYPCQQTTKDSSPRDRWQTK